MSTFSLGDYVDVPARVKMLFDRWPNARIVESIPQIRLFDGREWVEVTVTIHLGDDTTPVVASAWECKGTTSYTRDSEMMNCSTSAVGRACGLLGLGIGKSIASRNEVQMRQPAVAPVTPNDENPFHDENAKQYASPKQRGMIRARAFEKKIGTTELMPYINKVLGNEYSSIEALSKQEASQVIDSLQD